MRLPPGHTDQVALALRKEIERLKKVPVSGRLERVNTGTGRIVAIAQIKYGDGSAVVGV